jgi:hypothetical protein
MGWGINGSLRSAIDGGRLNYGLSSMVHRLVLCDFTTARSGRETGGFAKTPLPVIDCTRY